jgi:hypothetical protein
MAGDKRRRDVIHDHQVEYFAWENGLTSDEAWELILKHGNNRGIVIKAAKALRSDDQALKPSRRSLGHRHEGPSANALDNLMACAVCGQPIDMRDFRQVAYHDQPEHEPFEGDD